MMTAWPMLTRSVVVREETTRKTHHPQRHPLQDLSSRAPGPLAALAQRVPGPDILEHDQGQRQKPARSQVQEQYRQYAQQYQPDEDGKAKLRRTGLQVVIDIVVGQQQLVGQQGRQQKGQNHQNDSRHQVCGHGKNRYDP